MHLFTKTIENKEYIETIIKILDEVDQIIDSKNVVYTTNNQTFITERLSTTLRHIVQKGNKLERLLKNQILEAAYKAEKAGPNSTKLFLSLISSLIRELIEKIENGQSQNEIRLYLDEMYNNLSKRLEETATQPKWKDIVECVKTTSNSALVSDMVLEAVQLAGLEGNIIPGGSPNGQYSVELVSGFNFPVSTYPLFTDEDNGRWGRGEVRALVVDGVIERASEVHKILSEAYENKRPHLFVARGYGEEVIATIAANKDLDVCPIRVPWELESINFIADISIVCGGEIISSLKGDMLVNVNYSNLPVVDKVICTKENLNIINSKTQQAVSNHVSDLSKRREETHIEEMSEFLNKRIKALNSHTVHIRIGAKTEQQKIKELESVDYALRIAKGILKQGIVKVNELDINEKLPTISVLSAAYYGISLARSIMSVDCVIMKTN